MTSPVPQSAPGTVVGLRSPDPAAGTQSTARPATLVLSRHVKAGHEAAFEDVLHRLAEQVRHRPGHLDLTVLTPPPGGPGIYTVVSHFASTADADAWLASPQRARLIAEAGLHAAGDLDTRYVSGLEGWLAAPGTPVLVPLARWRTALISAAGILPLLEVVSYLLAPRLAALPVWARPLVSVLIVIPLMQYAAMPILTRAARPFLYPARPPAPQAVHHEQSRIPPRQAALVTEAGWLASGPWGNPRLPPRPLRRSDRRTRCRTTGHADRLDLRQISGAARPPASPRDDDGVQQALDPGFTSRIRPVKGCLNGGRAAVDHPGVPVTPHAVGIDPVTRPIAQGHRGLIGFWSWRSMCWCTAPTGTPGGSLSPSCCARA